jgi:predicted LPLAT superfamily acyltransferase
MRWDAAKELGSVRGLAFLFWVYRILGRWPYRLFAAPVVLWAFAFKPVSRQASMEYLSRALKRPAGAADCLRLFFSFADSILDKFIAWNRGFDLSDVEYHGLEVFNKVLASGRGCVLIVSHLGTLEVGRALSSKLHPGLELQVLMHTRHAENFNRILKQLDPSSQMNLHQVAFLSQRLERGAVVVVAGDRVPIGAGQRVGAATFLGGEADFPQGPYILAAALGCPILLSFCLRRPRGPKSFDLYFEPFEERLALPRKGRDQALQALIGRYAARLEHYCAQAPFQWYNFHPFWRDSRRSSEPGASSEVHQTEIPHREGHPL